MFIKFYSLLFSCSFLFIIAQKKPLDHSVYDSWQNIGERKISNDGRWTGYTVEVQEGDSKAYFYDGVSGKTIDFPRGYKIFFTDDSKFAAFLIKPFYKDSKAVKDKKMKKDKLAKDSLVVLNLTTGKTEKTPNVKSFIIPEKGKSVIAYFLENLKDKSDNSEKEDDENSEKEKQEKPLTLVVENLLKNEKTSYENVLRYRWSKNGKTLSMVTSKQVNTSENSEEKEKESKKKKEKKDKSKPEKYPLETVALLDLEKNKLTQLEEMEGDFTQLSLDDEGKQLAYLSTSSAKNDLVKQYQLTYYKVDTQKKYSINQGNPEMKKDWVVSENKTPEFSKNGKQLYFGVIPKPIAKDTALITNDHAIVDIWGYKDDYLQTEQLKRLKNELKKSHLSVLQTDTPLKFQTIGNIDLDTVRIMNEGNSINSLGISSVGNRISSQWTGSTKKTYFLIDHLTGNKTEVIKDLDGNVFPSPLGNFLVIFNRENGNWYSYNTRNQQTKQLNKNLKVSFTDEEFDMPDFPTAYGIAAWTNQDESVIIKDRYDLWEFFLSSDKLPRNLTQNFGRKNKITFDAYQFDKDIKSLNRKSKILVSAFDHTTKANGLYTTIINEEKEPSKLIMENVWGYKSLQKAKNKEQYILIKESYTQSPNLFYTENLSSQKQITNTNPQQNEYLWGTDELVNWKTPMGNESVGILYKPENFDPQKKYPMIVYFYEKLSDNLHRYIAPSPTPSRLNISYFVSNGYLVFTPDISYKDGQPGESAMEYINSGVQYLAKNPWVAADKIGIQGQSWGGYQVAYLIAHTNMYAAAWSGAPVANMTSAYGGIRWTSGLNRQFQYEKSQSRIGKTLWEAPELYIKNSPLFQLDKVKTPVVIMSNDKDGAVPWYQGIEMFTALRRLGKTAWLLNYNGDDHNLVKRQNRKDIQIREQQFFDYYLKGAKAPAWMTKGIPAIEKGKTWGFELTDEKP